jgi:hypothetical protein
MLDLDVAGLELMCKSRMGADDQQSEGEDGAAETLLDRAEERRAAAQRGGTKKMGHGEAP